MNTSGNGVTIRPAIWRLLIFELWHRNFLEKIGTIDFSDSFNVNSVAGNLG